MNVALLLTPFHQNGFAGSHIAFVFSVQSLSKACTAGQNDCGHFNMADE